MNVSRTKIGVTSPFQCFTDIMLRKTDNVSDRFLLHPCTLLQHVFCLFLYTAKFQIKETNCGVVFTSQSTQDYEQRAAQGHNTVVNVIT